MNANPTSSCRFIAGFVSMLARWLLASVFLYMGFNKALDPVSFLKLLRQYDLTHSPLLLNSLASALPWFEVFCGLLLLAGIAVRGTALTVLFLLIPFTGVLTHRAMQLQAALNIPFCAVKFDCGCGTGEEFICRKLLENSLLILLAVWLLAGNGGQLSLRYGRLKPTSGW